MTDDAYNSAKDFIYTIGGREMSTDSTIVADVFSAIRRIMEEPDSELNDWAFLLNMAESQLREACSVAGTDLRIGDDAADHHQPSHCTDDNGIPERTAR